MKVDHSRNEISDLDVFLSLLPERPVRNRYQCIGGNDGNRRLDNERRHDLSCVNRVFTFTLPIHTPIPARSVLNVAKEHIAFRQDLKDAVIGLKKLRRELSSLSASSLTNKWLVTQPAGTESAVEVAVKALDA